MAEGHSVPVAVGGGHPAAGAGQPAGVVVSPSTKDEVLASLRPHYAKLDDEHLLNARAGFVGANAWHDQLIGLIDAEIARRYGEAGRLALEKAGKTHGKVSVDLPGDLKLEAQVSQKVEWDQDKLQEIAKSLPDMATINHYFGIKFNVSEKIYKAIPPGDLRAKFEAARTTKLGDLKITLTRRDTATAAQAAGG